ncbi:MAG TPA: serine hydrolase, partial [Nitrosopumilaceae archaeon]|nr:serine hydrolase [Nitrosopumilaceae archaeon]
MTRIFIVFVLSVIGFSCNEIPAQQGVKDGLKITLSVGKKISPEVINEKKYRLDTLFNFLYKSNAFNGNVLISQSGTIIYQKSFGIADKEKNIVLSDSSMFQIASVSKVITATAILKLCEENELSLNDPVAKYIPGFPYTNVQVSHLITHRSGLPNYIYFCSGYLHDSLKELSNSDVIELMNIHKPEVYLKPGIRFNYCNTNYALLAVIIEKVCGKSYQDVIKEKIFAPVGMTHSFFFNEMDKQDLSVKTKGYTGSMKAVEKNNFENVYGDKGIYTTSYDLFLFNEAYFSGKLLKTETLKNALSPQSKERKLSNYGYGW